MLQTGAFITEIIAAPVPAEKVLGFSFAIIDRDLVDGFPNKQKNFTPLGDLVNPAKFGTVLFE